jgi:hypothetical protein
MLWAAHAGCPVQPSLPPRSARENVVFEAGDRSTGGALRMWRAPTDNSGNTAYRAGQAAERRVSCGGRPTRCQLFSTFPNRELLAPRFHAGLIPANINYAAAILAMTAQRIAVEYLEGTTKRLACLQAHPHWPQRQYSSSTYTKSPASSSLAGRVLWAAQVCKVILVQQGMPHQAGDIPVLYSTSDGQAPSPPHWGVTQGFSTVPVLQPRV